MGSTKVEIGRRERKREQTKQSLIKAAMDLFVAKGYTETTIDDIVAAADVAKVTFYYYFKSKEEIVLEFKKNAADDAFKRAKKLLADGEPAPEVLKSLITDICKWTEQNWQLLEVFATQRFSPLMKDEHCHEHDKANPLAALIEQIISTGKESGHFRDDVDGQEAAHFIVLAIMSGQVAWIREGRPKKTLLPKMHRCFDFILHGIVAKN
jgi:AcrR family transcriptional regulator